VRENLPPARLDGAHVQPPQGAIGLSGFGESHQRRRLRYLATASRSDKPPEKDGLGFCADAVSSISYKDPF
jgi:hypothetical protein